MAPASTQIINGAVKILQGFIFLVKLIKVPYWYRHTRTTTQPLTTYQSGKHPKHCCFTNRKERICICIVGIACSVSKKMKENWHVRMISPQWTPKVTQDRNIAWMLGRAWHSLVILSTAFCSLFKFVLIGDNLWDNFVSLNPKLPFIISVKVFICFIFLWYNKCFSGWWHQCSCHRAKTINTNTSFHTRNRAIAKHTFYHGSAPLADSL